MYIHIYRQYNSSLMQYKKNSQSIDKYRQIRTSNVHGVTYIVKLPCGFHLINHNKFRSVSNCIREQRWPNHIIYIHIGTRRNYTRNDNTHHCKFYSDESVNRSSTRTRCADYRAVYQLASAWKLL